MRRNDFVVLPFLVVLFYCCLVAANRDPYQVLGLGPSATQSQIKQSYRKLCLKYHPDKNRDNPKRKEFESKFKDVQDAYERIGTAKSRQQYDAGSKFSGFKGYTGHTSNQNRNHSSNRQKNPRGFYQPRQRASASDWNEFFSESSRRKRQGSTANTFDDLMRAYQKMFDDSAKFNRSFQRPGFEWTEGKDSIFHQRVRVPLEELYRGNDDFEFQFGHERPWTNVMAAFRGGIGPIYLYRSIIYAVPLYKLSGWLAAAVAAYFFHQSLPKPKTRKQFRTAMPSGCKGGSMFVFEDDANSKVKYHFEVVPLKHELFRLEGNALWTTFTLSPQKARRGCKARLEGLSGKLIHVKFPSKLKDGQVLTVPGEGWPRVSNSSSNWSSHQTYGDLKIQVRVSSKRQGQSR